MFGIGFLNSIFLFALSAALIPAIIHILNRRKAGRIRFSTLRFIEELSKRRMRSVNLRRLIVLILRTLAVLFLVLAFARPTLTALAGFLNPARGAGEVVICIDNSFSMGVEREKGSVFSEAKEIARRIVDECGTKDRINILVFSDKSEAIFREGTSDHELAKKVIGDIPISERGTDITSAIKRALDMAREFGYPRSEIYVVSDFRTAGDSLVIPEDLGSTRLILLPVYEDEIDNVSIDRIYTPRKLIRPGEVIHLGVVVTNHSTESEASFPLEVLVGDRRIAEKHVELPPLSTLTVSFAFTLGKRGSYYCRVRKNRDRLATDDERFFLLEISKTIPVLIVRGRGSAGEPSPGSYFYIAKALDPRPGRTGEREFAVIIKREDLITVEDLPARGAVIWVDPGTGGGRTGMFRDYVRNGGAMAVFLGNAGRDILTNRDFLEFIGAGKVERVFGDKVTGMRNLQSSHPIFDLFKEEELKLLSQVQVDERVEVSGVAPDSILVFTDEGTPLVWERVWGKGRVVVFAAAPDVNGGNLPLSPMFLPLMHTVSYYLANAALEEMGRDNYVGRRLNFHPSKRLRRTGMNLTVERDGKYVGKPVLFDRPSGEVGVFYSTPEEKGFYSLLEDTAVVAESAVNPDPRESNLKRTFPEGPSQGGATVVHPGGAFLSELREARTGREVFAIFFIFSLVCLVAESLIGRRG